MSPRRLAAIALAVGFGLAACGGDDEGGGGTDGPRPDAETDAMDVDAPPAVTLTSYVIDLVTNQTAGNTDPRPYDDFAQLPDPDADNPAAYGALFP